MRAHDIVEASKQDEREQMIYVFNCQCNSHRAHLFVRAHKIINHLLFSLHETLGCLNDKVGGANAKLGVLDNDLG